jgi:Domain of unknown function (DUF4145)
VPTPSRALERGPPTPRWELDMPTPNRRAFLDKGTGRPPKNFGLKASGRRQPAPSRPSDAKQFPVTDYAIRRRPGSGVRHREVSYRSGDARLQPALVRRDRRWGLRFGDLTMKCPTCLQNTMPEQWTNFETLDPRKRFESAIEAVAAGSLKPQPEAWLEAAGGTSYSLDWMRCGNEDCKQLVIRMHVFTQGGYERSGLRETWFVLPRFGSTARPVDPLVPENFRRDFLEAAAILDLSPRMSAVLARSILADLLREYAHHDEFQLEARIDSFNKNAGHPRPLRENLHRFREAANLSAHTATSDQGEVIRIERDEADWTLELVERLFEYLIVTPAVDKKMRDSIYAKINAAGRKPIKPLPDDPLKPD